ncbi:peptidoglycan DD-metalloendopeptidase family protein [Staphylococcus sp. LKG3-3]|uniref:peptidoglycan DD-metalloendopeptidase family protein n=1 Tax=Staphylococcus sp. LKG3-3 TaxID=3399685 RepID=UPI003D3BB524
MVEVNKVDIGFTADVSSFNRGVDRMERKLEHFDKTATKSTDRVGKRFDFLDGELKKVEKTMGGFGDDLDLNRVQKQLEKAKTEFEETGKVGQRSMDKLNNAVKRVDFSTMPTKAHKAFTTVQKDVSKLSIETDKLNRVKFADGFTNENKLIAHSFADLDKAMNNTKLSFDNASKHMNSKQLQEYVKSTNNARHALFGMKKELEQTGTVSSQTFYKVNESMKKVNFNQLNVSAQRAVKNVSRQFGTLTKTFDNVGTQITKNQNRMRNFSKVTGGTMRYLKNSASDTMTTFNRWATVFRNIQEVGEHVFGGVLRPLILSLVPIAGTATTAIMGIGAGLGTVAGGAIGLGGAFGMSLIAVKAFTGQATTALKMLEDGQLKVTGEVKRYQSALKGLQGDWKSLINQNQARIFNTMSNGINMARYSLTTLNPFLVKTAAHIEKASSKMHKWVTSSQNATAAFKMLNKIGPPIFGNVLNAAGHMGNGITRIFTAFGPLFTWTGQGLEKLSKKFDTWANSDNTQRGIESFINYTKSNLPILGSIFGNTFLGIIELFKAFSGQTTWALKGLDGLTKRFRNWAATLDETQGFKDFINFSRKNAPLVGEVIGNLVDMLVQMVRVMAPVSVQVLKIVNAILAWVATHPAVAKMIGYFIVFAGLMKSGLFIASMINSFTGLSKAIKLLVGTQKLQIFWQKLFNKEQIKSKGIIAMTGGGIKKLALWIKNLTLWQKIGRGAQALWNGVTAAGTAIANGYRYAIALLSTAQGRAAIKTKAMAIATGIWAGITKGAALATKLFALSFKGLGMAIKSVPLIGWALAVIGVLIYLWQTNATFRKIVIGAWNAIKAAAIAVFGWLKPYLTAIWNGIKTAAIWSWNAIKTAAIATWNAVKFAILHPIQTLKSGLSAIWSGIKFAALWAWNSIKAGVMFIINAWIAGVKLQFSVLKGFFTAIWNGIKTATLWIWNGIKNGVMFIVRAWLAQVRANFNTLKGFFVAIWNGIKNVSLYVWRAIKNGVLAAIRGLSTGVRAIISTLRTWLVTAWNYIKSKVVGAARLIWTGVRTAFNYLSVAVRKIITNLRTWLVKAWTYIKSKVVALARALWFGVRTAFNSMSAIVRRIITNLRTWIVKAWTYIRNKVVALAKSLWHGVKGAFDAMSAIVRKIISNLRNWLVKAWTYIRNKVVALVKSLWHGVKNTFNNLWSGTRNIFNKVKNYIVNLWKGIRNSVTGFVKSMWNGVRGTMNKMRDGISNIVGKIKGTFKSLVGAVGKGLNKLIDGVNWVGKKLGMDKLKHVNFSTGTTHTHKQNLVSNGRLKQGTMATVGDKGKGNGKGGYRNEVVELPNGKRFMTPSTDTNMYLPAKSKVYSGAQTQAAGLPRFSTGTGTEDLPAGGGGIIDAVNNGKKKIAGMGSSMAHSAHGAVKRTKETASDIAKVAGSNVAKGTGWLKSQVKDVLDFMDKPSKLVDHVFKAFGVGFDFIKEPLPADMMSGAFKMLKKSTIDKIKGWLEESGGGDGNYIDLSRLNYGFGTPPGYPFGRHDGIDIDYKYEKLYSTIAGQARGIKDNGNGFGNHMWIKAANAIEVIYGHMSKLAFSSKRVKPGSYLGVSGNTGQSTGPHLHYEMRWNGQAKNPIPWLKKHDKGGGGKSGKWGGNIRQALKLAGLPTSNSYVNAWAKQIQTESGGNPKAMGGTDGLADGAAKGLVQVKPGTFNAYKLPGHGNIWNGLDNLIAGMRYAKARYGKGGLLQVIGRGHGYENGGIINSPEMAWLAEGGFSESIISHDPANKVKSKAIHDRTGEMLGFNDDVVIMRMLADLMRENNMYQADIASNTERVANKSSVITMNSKKVAQEVAGDVNSEIKKQEARKLRMKGRN